ncbi:YnfC family lipoprotein, partial [Escherichia coli]|nr:YnfC family lipoprotein [Escherichia coli]
MKYKLLPCLLAILLTGCDRTEVTLSFTPEMASFSNEFDFDPLRGPVKDFTQTLMDEQGEVTKRVSGTLSEEGCFGNDSNLLIVFYVQIMPDDLVMQLHR